jgi:hypothetical protein
MENEAAERCFARKALSGAKLSVAPIQSLHKRNGVITSLCAPHFRSRRSRRSRALPAFYCPTYSGSRPLTLAILPTCNGLLNSYA